MLNYQNSFLLSVSMSTREVIEKRYDVQRLRLLYHRNFVDDLPESGEVTPEHFVQPVSILFRGKNLQILSERFYEEMGSPHPYKIFFVGATIEELATTMIFLKRQGIENYLFTGVNIEPYEVKKAHLGRFDTSVANDDDEAADRFVTQQDFINGGFQLLENKNIRFKSMTAEGNHTRAYVEAISKLQPISPDALFAQINNVADYKRNKETGKISYGSHVEANVQVSPEELAKMEVMEGDILDGSTLEQIGSTESHVIVINNVLLHFTRPAQYLAVVNTLRQLKNGGILTVHHNNSLGYAWEQYAQSLGLERIYMNRFEEQYESERRKAETRYYRYHDEQNVTKNQKVTIDLNRVIVGDNQLVFDFQ